jgi:hypothetical protein
VDEIKLDETLREIATYACHATDWQTVKKELLKSLPPADRKFFSTRDPYTKKQVLNEFESTVVDKWRKLTGVQLIIKDYDKSSKKGA